MIEADRTVFLEVLGASPQLRLLDFFLDSPKNDFSRREIMEDLGMAKRTLYTYLPVLLKKNLIKVTRKIGRAELYALNRESVIVQHFIGVDKELTRPEIPSEAEIPVEESPDLILK